MSAHCRPLARRRQVSDGAAGSGESSFVILLPDGLVLGADRIMFMLQYVPLPVIGGYLGYVGYFCIAGGASLAAGIEVRVSEVSSHPLVRLQ